MHTKPTRRTFFGHAGAALAAPLAAAAAVAADGPGDDLTTRLAALEDANTIRALLQDYAHGINAGRTPAPDAHVRRLRLDGDIAIEVVGDGNVTARAACSVETATPIDGAETLVEMARLQGDGIVKRTEPRTLVGVLVKHGGIWVMENVEIRA